MIFSKQNQTDRAYSISVCYLPVCVDLICVVEQVEFGNISGGSRINGFLLDEKQMFSGVFSV